MKEGKLIKDIDAIKKANLATNELSSWLYEV